MKKVLALVLAVMMLATVAFAADATVDKDLTGSNEKVKGSWLPGDTIKITDSGFVTEFSNDFVLWADKANSTKTPVKAFNNTNYTITGVKYTEGKALVASVKLSDANDRIEIVLNSDYSNTNKKALDLTFTMKGKKVGKADKAPNFTIRVVGTVGYALEESTLYLSKDGDVVLPKDVTVNGTAVIGFAKEKLYKVKDSGDVNYGTLEFTAEDGDTDVEVRVYDGDKLYLYNNVDADSDILKKYADEDADITFLNFPGKPTFNATATVRFYKEEGTYIYELKDGNLTAITAEAASAGAAGQTAGKVKWDEDEGCYILKTRTLGNYVFSDVALPLDVANNTTDTPVTNPDTGANDVVGIATALAAVALVSAAAVSLKK